MNVGWHLTQKKQKGSPVLSPAGLETKHEGHASSPCSTEIGSEHQEKSGFWKINTPFIPRGHRETIYSNCRASEQATGSFGPR